jgi:hypothetical protein
MCENTKDTKDKNSKIHLNKRENQWGPRMVLGV